VIRVDSIWLCTGPADMRCGMDTLLSRVINVFGAAQPHHVYLFANARASRMKAIVHDGFGIWLCTRRLHSGRFVWERGAEGTLQMSRAQFDALVLGLSWRRLSDDGAIGLI
jgi:transposase